MTTTDTIGWKWVEFNEAKRHETVSRINAGSVGSISDDDACDCVEFMSATLRKRLGLFVSDFGVMYRPHYRAIDRIGEVFDLAVLIHAATPPVTPETLRVAHFDLDERYALTRAGDKLIEFVYSEGAPAAANHDDGAPLALACGNFSFGFAQRGGVAYFNYCAQFCSVIASTVSQRMGKEARNNAVDRNFVLLGEHLLRTVPKSAGNQRQLFQVWARIPLVRALQSRNHIFPSLVFEKDNLRKLVHRVHDTVDFYFVSSSTPAAVATKPRKQDDSDDEDDNDTANDAAAAALKEAEPGRTFHYRRVGAGAGRVAKLTHLGTGLSPNSNYTIEVRAGKPVEEVLARIERAVRRAESQLAATSAVRSMSKHDLCVAYNDVLERETKPWLFSSAVLAPPRK